MTRDFENHQKHLVKINLCAFLDLGLEGHTLQSLFSPFHKRKISPISHTSSFHVKIKKSSKRYLLRVILFSEVLSKTSSNDAKSLKISMPCGR